MPSDREIAATLSRVTTATITTILLKKGLRNVWMRGTRPLNPGQPRLVGKAFTLRFVPAREDLATPESWAKPISTRAAIEAMPEGSARTRTTMSSLKPNQVVVSVASRRPAAESEATTSQPRARAASIARCMASAGAAFTRAGLMSG